MPLSVSMTDYIGQGADVTAGGLLKDAEIKLRKNGQYVVKNIGLNSLVIGPRLIITENVNLNRQTVLAGRQLPDQKGHIIMNFGVVPQIGDQIVAEGADIGQVSAVDQFGSVNTVLGIKLGDLFSF